MNWKAAIAGMCSTWVQEVEEALTCSSCIDGAKKYYRPGNGAAVDHDEKR